MFQYFTNIHLNKVLTKKTDKRITMQISLTTYPTAGEFLAKTQSFLERQEAVNALILGVTATHRDHPDRVKHPPYLAAIEDQDGLAAAAMMTPPHNLALASDRESYTAILETIAQDLHAHNWHVPGVIGPAHLAESFAQIWTRLFGGSCQIAMNQRVYELRAVIPPQPVPGRMRTAETEDLPWLTTWMQKFFQEADTTVEMNQEATRQLTETKIADHALFYWEDQNGQPVSMSLKTRPTTHGIAVSGVYTSPQHRRQGFAAQLVAALSQSLLDSGHQFTTLFTDLANPTSNSIYQKIGYQPVCDFNMYRFVHEA